MVGVLRRVPLREVWRHEATDFTRWLEENLEVLGETVGLELTATEREGAAGRFSVDLVAEDASGHVVVIENQLERSDHDHLGKIVTYTAVLEASTAIWIVSDPRPEHVAAVGWLNESRDSSFFLVKAEAVVIGDSQPAALLTLIVGPSEETREAGDTKRDLAEAQLLRKRFWEGLLAEAAKVTNLHSAVRPGTDNWIAAGAGVSGLSFNYVATKHSARVEFYIDRGDADLNDQLFRALMGKHAEIEADFGESLGWLDLPARRACRIQFEIPGIGYRDEEGWPQLHPRLADAMRRLELALKPALAELR